LEALQCTVAPKADAEPSRAQKGALKSGERNGGGICVRNVIVIPGELVIESGDGARKMHGKPLYFSHQNARGWVDRKHAVWVGQGEKRIRLTPSGQKFFLEMKATLRLRGFSAVVGETVAMADKPWARAFANDQLDRPIYHKP
jgi:hypothetical protein